jgi:hypothetical protein
MPEHSGTEDAFDDLLGSFDRDQPTAPLTRRQLREAAAKAAQQSDEADVDGVDHVVHYVPVADQVDGTHDVMDVGAAEDEEIEPADDGELDVPSWVNPGNYQEEAQTPVKKSRRSGCLTAFLIVAVLFGGVATAGVWAWNTYGDRILEQLGLGGPKDYEPGEEGDPVFIRISEGDSGCSISNMLFVSGVTKKSDSVCDMLLKSGENPTLFAGIFELRERMTSANALAILTDKNNVVSGEALRAQTFKHAVDATAKALSLDSATLAQELPAPFAAGGFVIGEREFYDSASMDAEEIQTFLDEQLPACESNDCLKDSVKSYDTLSANAFCAEQSGASGQGVAGILHSVADACGINPKLLLVALNEPLSFDLGKLAGQLTTSIASGGNIISDADFYNASAMTASEIQAFLEQQVSACDEGAVCLKDFTATHSNRSANQYCGALSGGSNDSAAEIIAKVAQACGINPQVLLIMLEKEQQLVSSTSPSQEQFDRAMGHACPDTGENHSANCDPAFAGFATQVYHAARQMQLYTKNPSSYQYRAGRVNTIQWAPSPSCGTSQVHIENQATANLYIYTPYRPNLASLAAGWGSGDACSTYGNRNFHGLFVTWFAPERAPFLGTPMQVATCTVPPAREIRSARSSVTVTAEEVLARSAPIELCDVGTEQLVGGDELVITGTYGAWSRFQIDGEDLWVPTAALSSTR